MKTMTWAEFSSAYCERQENTPEVLRDISQKQDQRFQPIGFMLLECQMIGGSRLGEYVILPYGPNNTYKDIPQHPISPRGLASDMSVVVGILPATAIY
jgi:hypothetical protein